MKENEEHIDELIAKYLAGEALPEEAIWLDEWKNQSDKNLTHFNHSKKAIQFTLDERMDTQALYKRIQLQLNPAKPVFKLNSYLTPFRIAAAIILISFLGFIGSLIFKTAPQPELIFASAETMQEQALPDGSQIALNKHSKLTLATDFNTKQRKVRLEGEAFFEIKHDEQKPFLVEAGGLSIKDIGTAFNVKAETESDSVFVFVTEGIVELSNLNDVITLHKNEGATYIKSTKTFLGNTKANSGAYKTKQFHFSGTTLREVSATLNTVYGTIIQLDNEQIGSCTISVDFQNESPEVMVTIIAETLGLTVEHLDGIYLLKGKSCMQ
jgi:transmembrane sensor